MLSPYMTHPFQTLVAPICFVILLQYYPLPTLLFTTIVLVFHFYWSKPVNPLSHKSVRNKQMDLLMKRLNELHSTTKEWKKPNTGNPCNHMHVECWSGVFMCSGCHQEVTDPDRVHVEQTMMERLGAEDPSQPEDSINRGVTIAFLVAFCQTFNLSDLQSVSVTTASWREPREDSRSCASVTIGVC